MTAFHRSELSSTQSPASNLLPPRSLQVAEAAHRWREPLAPSVTAAREAERPGQAPPGT